jgi:membrane protease YdiL (CAAX protease family)
MILNMDFINLLLALLCGLGMSALVGFLSKRSRRRHTQTVKTLLNAAGSLILALPVIYLGIPLGIVSVEKLGLDRFLWWWFPASLGLAIALILLNAGIALLYQRIFKIDEKRLVSHERTSYFDKMAKSPRSFSAMIVFGGVIAPVCEELYFRGLLLSWFLAFFNPWVGIVATSAIFALAHFDSAGVMVTGLIDGVAFSLLFVATGSIWVPIIVHIFNNSIGLALLNILS